MNPLQQRAYRTLVNVRAAMKAKAAKKKAKVNYKASPDPIATWILLPLDKLYGEQEEMSLNDGLSVMKATVMLKQARANLIRDKEWGRKSVLNPDLTAEQSWEIVWKELLKYDALGGIRIPAWLEKRVRQVCTNTFDGNPPKYTIDDLKDPEPAPAPVPFERKFS